MTTAPKKKTAAASKKAAAVKKAAPDLAKIREEIRAELETKFDQDLEDFKSHARKQVREDLLAEQAQSSENFQAELDTADAALAGDFPRYFDLAQHLTQDQRSALAYLEETAGAEIFIHAKVDEVTEKSGHRRRTFCKAGKYDLVLAIKDVRVPVERPKPAQATDAEQGNLFEQNQAKINQMDR